jgi:MOSC domain
MTHHDLVDRIAGLLHEHPEELRKAGISDELNLQGWLSARNLRLIAADLRGPRDRSRPSGSLPQQRAGATGVIEALLTAAHAEDTMERHRTVELHAGRGIVGDRYFDGTGTFSASEKQGRQLTLIEAEVLDSLRDEGLHLTPVDARRNVVTREIDLNALVGREFRIGTVRCIGRRLCEPCSHLQRLTGTALLRPMIHRGGLRADILTSGVVHVDDAVDA